MQVFLYGTLLDPAILARRSGRQGLARRALVATLPGWRRVPLRQAPYPTLIRARGHATDGLFLAVSGAPLRRLMAYEGSAYRLRPLRLLTSRGPRRAMAWIAAPALATRPGTR